MELFPTLQISRRDRSIPSLGGLYRQAHFFPSLFFFFQAEDGIRDIGVTGVQTCALPISFSSRRSTSACAKSARARRSARRRRKSSVSFCRSRFWSPSWADFSGSSSENSLPTALLRSRAIPRDRKSVV